MMFGENYGDGTLLKQLKREVEWLEDAYDAYDHVEAMHHTKNLMEGAFVMWRRLMEYEKEGGDE